MKRTATKTVYVDCKPTFALASNDYPLDKPERVEVPSRADSFALAKRLNREHPARGRWRFIVTNRACVEVHW